MLSLSLPLAPDAEVSPGLASAPSALPYCKVCLHPDVAAINQALLTHTGNRAKMCGTFRIGVKALNAHARMCLLVPPGMPDAVSSPLVPDVEDSLGHASTNAVLPDATQPSPLPNCKLCLHPDAPSINQALEAPHCNTAALCRQYSVSIGTMRLHKQAHLGIPPTPKQPLIADVPNVPETEDSLGSLIERVASVAQLRSELAQLRAEVERQATLLQCIVQVASRELYDEHGIEKTKWGNSGVAGPTLYRILRELAQLCTATLYPGDAPEQEGQSDAMAQG